MDPVEAGKQAEDGAYLTRAIPGASGTAAEVARIAQRIKARLDEPFP
jgi:hypothetical protein